MTRIDRRNADQLRRFKITKYFQKYPAGSVLIETGNTKVICAATIQDGVPSFLRGSGTGWLNAEYSLLPSATLTRSPREASRGRQNGRTQEIQRLIGRCLRSVMDFKALGGAFVALAEALATIYDPKKPFPLKDFMAAISVGISKNNEPILDLCYEEDSTAIADMNIVMTGEGHFVEIQGTGEKQPFTHEQFSKMLAYAQKGIDELISYQKDILGNDLVWKIGRIP